MYYLRCSNLDEVEKGAKPVFVVVQTLTEEEGNNSVKESYHDNGLFLHKSPSPAQPETLRSTGTPRKPPGKTKVSSKPMISPSDFMKNAEKQTELIMKILLDDREDSASPSKMKKERHKRLKQPLPCIELSHLSAADEQLDKHVNSGSEGSGKCQVTVIYKEEVRGRRSTTTARLEVPIGRTRLQTEHNRSLLLKNRLRFNRKLNRSLCACFLNKSGLRAKKPKVISWRKTEGRLFNTSSEKCRKSQVKVRKCRRAKDCTDFVLTYRRRYRCHHRKSEKEPDSEHVMKTKSYYHMPVLTGSINNKLIKRDVDPVTVVKNPDQEDEKQFRNEQKVLNSDSKGSVDYLNKPQTRRTSVINYVQCPGGPPLPGNQLSHEETSGLTRSKRAFVFPQKRTRLEDCISRNLTTATQKSSSNNQRLKKSSASTVDGAASRKTTPLSDQATGGRSSCSGAFPQASKKKPLQTTLHKPKKEDNDRAVCPAKGKNSNATGSSSSCVERRTAGTTTTSRIMVSACPGAPPLPSSSYKLRVQADKEIYNPLAHIREASDHGIFPSAEKSWRNQMENHEGCVVISQGYLPGNKFKFRVIAGTPKALKPAICLCCNQRMSSQLELKDHYRKFHYYRCKMCFMDFKDELDLETHRSVVHKKEHHKCSLCNEIFLSYHYFHRHCTSKRHLHNLEIQERSFKEILKEVLNLNYNESEIPKDFKPKHSKFSTHWEKNMPLDADELIVHKTSHIEKIKQQILSFMVQKDNTGVGLYGKNCTEREALSDPDPSLLEKCEDLMQAVQQYEASSSADAVDDNSSKSVRSEGHISVSSLASTELWLESPEEEQRCISGSSEVGTSPGLQTPPNVTLYSPSQTQTSISSPLSWSPRNIDRNYQSISKSDSLMQIYEKEFDNMWDSTNVLQRFYI